MSRCAWGKPSCHEEGIHQIQMLYYCSNHYWEARNNNRDIAKKHIKSAKALSHYISEQRSTEVKVKGDIL